MVALTAAALAPPPTVIDELAVPFSGDSKVRLPAVTLIAPVFAIPFEGSPVIDTLPATLIVPSLLTRSVTVSVPLVLEKLITPGALLVSAPLIAPALSVVLIVPAFVIAPVLFSVAPPDRLSEPPEMPVVVATLVVPPFRLIDPPLSVILFTDCVAPVLIAPPLIVTPPEPIV